MIKVTLKPMASEELIQWKEQLKPGKWPVHNSTSLSENSANRCMQERVRRSVSRDKNRRFVVKEGTGIPYPYFGTSVSKACTFNLQQNDEIQVGAYSSREFGSLESSFGNGGNKESQTSGYFKQDIKYLFKHQIMITAEYLPKYLIIRQTGNQEVNRTWQSKSYIQKYSKKVTREEDKQKNLSPSHLSTQFPAYYLPKTNRKSLALDGLQKKLYHKHLYNSPLICINTQIATTLEPVSLPQQANILANPIG